MSKTRQFFFPFRFFSHLRKTSNKKKNEKQTVPTCNELYRASYVYYTTPEIPPDLRACCEFIARARKQGLSVIFITHNPHHAYLVGDRFLVLKLGRVTLSANRSEISLDELTQQMAGGAELDSLAHELGE